MNRANKPLAIYINKIAWFFNLTDLKYRSVIFLQKTNHLYLTVSTVMLKIKTKILIEVAG